MQQIAYISLASRAPTLSMVAEILSVSQINNERDGLTGTLLIDGGRFLQVLEGEKVKTERLLARLQQDDRHRAVSVLYSEHIGQRSFPEWTMRVIDCSTSHSVKLPSKLIRHAIASLPESCSRRIASSLVC